MSGAWNGYGQWEDPTDTCRICGFHPESPDCDHVECDDCGTRVPKDEVTSFEESGESICILCIERMHAEHERLGAEVRREFEATKVYREDGLLRPDGTYDLAAIRRLK